MDSCTAACVGVPLVFIPGDKGVCDEAAQLNRQIKTVAVKQGIGGSTINVHPEVAAMESRPTKALAPTKLPNKPLTGNFRRDKLGGY